MRIEISGVTVHFREQSAYALENVDLTVDEGEQVALLGPSGSGKTTLLRVVMGAVQPVAGQVLAGDLNPFGTRAEITELRRATGIVRQRDDLVLGLSARTNALMATAATWSMRDWLAVMRGGVPRRYKERLDMLATRHDITGCLPARVERLSGGQRQRVALVRALLPRPRLLLADEATSGLDPVTAAAAVNGLRRADAATLILTTHDLRVARRFPRIVALRAGRIVFDGPDLGERDVEDIYGTAEVPA